METGITATSLGSLMKKDNSTLFFGFSFSGPCLELSQKPLFFYFISKLKLVLFKYILPKTFIKSNIKN